MRRFRVRATKYVEKP